MDERCGRRSITRMAAYLLLCQMYLVPMPAGSAGWADVATIIPWNMYLAYGDKRILEEQYPSMKAWVGYMEQKSTNDLWNTGFHFGDWLFYRPVMTMMADAAITDKYLIAQCFYAHSTQLLINAASVLVKKMMCRNIPLAAKHKDCICKRIRNTKRTDGIRYTNRLCTCIKF